jgi:diphosphomevalonate decarboxylase
MNRGFRAVAFANIALAKYWGKADVAENLPAVPSLSLTLAGLRTVTEVRFDTELATDEVVLDGALLSGPKLVRVIELLDRVRARAGLRAYARVRSVNEFPTAAGLASSASGFAALALAATRAAGLELPPGDVSDFARRSSASAARSLFGGFASLGAGSRQAERVAPPEHWNVSMIVVLTATGPKAIGSTSGMTHTAATSPYYPAWLAHAPALYEEIKSAVLVRDLARLGAAMEQSALMMHGSMLAADPALVYFRPATLAVMERVRELRRAGTSAFYTMDAGPHVKVLTLAADAERVARELEGVPGVLSTIRCEPGPDASAEELA